MPSIEDILITFLGRDEVSPVAQSMASNTQSALSGLESNAISGANSIGQAYTSTFDTITQGLHTLNSAMMGLSSVNRTIMGEIGATKSAMEYVYGTTSTAETNKVLVRSWEDAQTSWKDIYDTVDSVTDRSLTSMQDLIPAMNAFRASTNATGQQLRDDVAENMAQFGAYVLALTGSEQLAKSAMTDLSKGLVGKGSFNAVDQYGVTKASLMARGWSGENEDITGYMNAVRQISGQVEELMNTSQGVDALMGKMWSRAGKKIGGELLPGVTNLKSAFMDLDKELDGNLSTSVLRVSLLIEETSKKAYVLNTLWDAFRNITQAVRMAGSILGIYKGVQDANNLSQKENNRLVKESNRLLMENNELRLTNADAMGYQNLLSGGYDTGVGGIPMSEAMGEDGSWGEDVLANTAGGILESKLQRGKNEDFAKQIGFADESEYYASLITAQRKKEKTVRNLSKQVRDEDASFKFLIDSYMEMNVRQRTVNDTLKETGFVYNEIKDTVGRDLSPKEANAIWEGIGSALGEEEKKILDLGHKVDDFKDVMNDTDMSSILTSRHDFMKPLTNKKGFKASTDKDLLKEAEILDLGDAWNKLKNVDMSAPPVDSTKILGGVTETIASVKVDAKKVGKELGTLEEEIDGPFRRLHNILTQKKKRQMPLKYDIWEEKLNEFSLTDKFKNAFARIKKPFKDLGDLKGDDKIDTLDNVWAKFKGIGKGSKVAEEVAEGGDEVVKGAEKIARTGQKAGAMAPAMAEAETGLTFLGLSEMGLVGAFTTLIVPTLAIAGVIAVLIPIVAGLAIEALFFINIVKDFFMGMNFSDVDMTSAIDGLSQLATALGWLALAMASLSVAGLMTAVATVITGFGQVEVVMGQAVDMLKRVVSVLNEFATGQQLKPGIAENITKVGEAINSVSLAMLSLVGTQAVSSLGALMTGFGYFGSLSQTFENAKNEIQKAIESINSMHFDGIDESKVSQLKTVLDAISSFADAFKGLQDIRMSNDIGNFTTWILNGGLLGGQGKTVQQAFASAHDDIKMATTALQGYNDIGTVDEGLATNLQNVGNAIKGVADGINNLRTIRDAYNWDDWVGGIFKGTDIQGAFRSAKDDIEAVSTELKNLTIADLPEGLADKITNMSTVLSGVSTAIDTMKNVAKASGGTTKGQDGKSTADIQLTSVVETIRTAKDKLIEVSQALRDLNGGGENQEGLADVTGLETKITNMTNSLNGVLGAIDVLNQIGTNTMGGENLSIVSSTIEKTKNTLTTVAGYLRDLNGEGGIGTIPPELDARITSLGNTLSAIANVSTAMITMPFVDPVGTGTKIKNAVDTFKNASTEVKRINEDDRVGDIQGIIDSVTNALNGLKTTIQGMNFSGEGRHIAQSLTNGVSQLNLQPVIHGRLASAVAGSGAWTQGQRMAQSLNNGFSSGLNLADSINSAIDSMISTIDGRLEEVQQKGQQLQDSAEGNGSGQWSLSINMGGEHMGGDSIGRYSSMLRNNEVDTSRLHAMSTMGKSSSNVSSQNSPTHIIISEGAVQVDANNLTKKEARQVLINGLEGLSDIKSITTN